MKTYKELKESITKALIKFGSKGLRKAAPNVFSHGRGGTIARYLPPTNFKQIKRVNYLKTKYQNVNKYKFGPGQMMKQKMIGVQPGVDPFDYGVKNPILPRLANQGKVDMFDANVKLQKNFAARQLDKLQGYKPTEMGPNEVERHLINLSSGKGEKARKRALEILKGRVPKNL
tara:strand:- start:107 stop:625 length:519 start_codon:yes stop_codon:yes gene_type:complete